MQEMYAAFNAWKEKFKDNILDMGAPLTPGGTVVTKTGTTDGPFVEAKEQLVGYSIVECETPERATEIAARWPDARYWAMEVRPIMEPGGEEM